YRRMTIVYQNRLASAAKMCLMLLEDEEPFRLGANERDRAAESAEEIKLVRETRRPGAQRRFDERAGEHHELCTGCTTNTAEGYVGSGDSWVAKAQVVR